MSDQTEKPKGALPKGYDANTPSTENTSSTEVVKQKKINFLELVRYTSTDQDQREKDLKEYEANYITRLEKNKPEEPDSSESVEEKSKDENNLEPETDKTDGKTEDETKDKED